MASTCCSVQISLMEECDYIDRALEELLKKETRIVSRDRFHGLID